MSQTILSLRKIVTQGLRESLPEFVLSLEQDDIESYIINGYLSRRFRLEGRFHATSYTKIMHSESDTHAESLLDARIPERSDNAIYSGEAVALIVKETGKVVRRGAKFCLTDLLNDAELVFAYQKPKPWSAWLLWQDQYYGAKHKVGEHHERVASPAPSQTRSDGDYEQLFTAGGRNQDYWVIVFQKAIDRRSRFGYSMDVVNTLTVLALIHIIYHDLSAAEEVLENAWKISVQLNDTSNSVLERLNTLGSIFEEYGRYGEAQDIYHRILERSDSATGGLGPLSLSARVNMILVLSKQGKYEEAATMTATMLDLKVQTLGLNHPSTLDTTSALGSLYRDLGKLSDAERLLERAVSGYESLLGKVHPSTIDALNSLGNLYADQGRLPEAEAALEQVLSLCEEKYGVEHVRTLDAVNNLALVYNAQGRLDEAEQMLLRAESGYEKELGADHLTTLDTVNNLGLVYQAQGKLDQAEQSYRSALRRREKVLGDENPLTLTSKNNLAEVLRQKGQYAEAEQLHRMALDSYEKALGKDHPDTLASMSNLSELLKEKEQHKQSRQPYQSPPPLPPPQHLEALNREFDVGYELAKHEYGDLSTIPATSSLRGGISQQHYKQSMEVENDKDAESPSSKDDSFGFTCQHAVATTCTTPQGPTTKLLTIDDYQVIWICARPIEIDVADALLDEIHDDKLLLRKAKDSKRYTLGRMHRHNVVIASLTEGIYGTYSANVVVQHALRIFPALTVGLLVGIGSGIPNIEKGFDIRLGDVVVSQADGEWDGVVQYDTIDRFHARRLKLESSQLYVSDALLTALSAVKAQHQNTGSRVPTYLAKMIHQNRITGKYVFPKQLKDYLQCSHTGSTINSCKVCGTGKVRRPPRNNTEPKIHYGVIVSGNGVIEDAYVRDRIGRACNALCIESEAAGIEIDFPCLMIRGICDYADAFKNDQWQRYAAASAAAFAKELLLYVPPMEEPSEEPPTTIRDSIPTRLLYVDMGR